MHAPAVHGLGETDTTYVPGATPPPAMSMPMAAVERALASLSLDDRGVAPIVDWQEAQRRQDAADRNASA